MSALWLITALSLLATVLNIRRRKECFCIWIATNLGWAFIDFRVGLPEQATLHLVYFAMALYGLITWTKLDSPGGDDGVPSSG